MQNINPILIIVGIPVAIAILLNPFLGLISIITLIPQALIQAVSGTLFGIFTMATPIKLIGALSFISVLIKNTLEKKELHFFKQKQIVWSALFLLWIVVSGLTQPGYSTRENFTVYISCAIFGFLILSLVNNLQRYRILLWAGIISISVVSIKGILDYIFFESIAVEAKNNFLRVTGESFDPNYFAIMLLPFLGVTFYNIFAERNKLLKTVSLLICFLVVIALIVTFSRGGIIGFFVMLLTASYKSKKKIKAIFLLLLTILILINVMPAKVWERFEKTKIEGESGEEAIASTKRRFLLAKAAWQIFLNNPLIGVGVGNFYYMSRLYQPIRPGRAHSTYLEIMAELGLIGIILFFILVFLSLRSLKKIASQNTLIGTYAKGLFIGLIGFLVAATFLHAQQEKVFWMIIFLSAALEKITISQIKE